jgi:hypothetical protein
MNLTVFYIHDRMYPFPAGYLPFQPGPTAAFACPLDSPARNASYCASTLPNAPLSVPLQPQTQLYKPAPSPLQLILFIHDFHSFSRTAIATRILVPTYISRLPHSTPPPRLGTFFEMKFIATLFTACAILVATVSAAPTPQFGGSLEDRQWGGEIKAGEKRTP